MKRLSVRFTTLCALVVFALMGVVTSHASQALAATSISTGAPTSWEDCLGYPNTTTYGQSITAPAGTTHLNSFTFYLQSDPAVLYRGEIFAWDGYEVVGNALGVSGPVHTSSTDAQPVTFNVGQAPVVPGRRYMLLITVDQDLAYDSGHPYCASMGLADASYAGGAFSYINDGGDMSQWYSVWDCWDCGEAAFTATFDSAAGSTISANRVSIVPYGPSATLSPVHLTGTGLSVTFYNNTSQVREIKSDSTADPFDLFIQPNSYVTHTFPFAGTFYYHLVLSGYSRVNGSVTLTQ